jgi:hypothetical protein
MHIGHWQEGQRVRDHLRRPKHRWEDIKMHPLQIGWGGMDWIGMAQDRDKWRALVNVVMNIRVL